MIAARHRSCRTRSPARRRIAAIHAWTGATLSVFILLVSLSGAASVFLGSWFELQFPELRISTTDRAGRASNDYLPAEMLVSNAVAGVEPGFRPLGLLMPRTRVKVDAASVYGLPAVARSEADVIFLTVNPYTGDFLGSFVLDNAFGHELVHFHAQLLSGATGELAVAILGLVLLGFSITGLYLWWPGRYVAPAKLKRFRATSRRWPSRIYALHSLAGFWLCLLVAFWSVTGTATAKPSWFGFASAYSAIPESMEPATADQCEGSVDLATSIAAARERVPDKRISGVEFPNPGRPAWLFMFLADGDWNRVAGDTQVWVHARCSNTVQQVNVAAADPGLRLGDAMLSIHSGRTFGAVGQALTFITGCALAFLSVSGLIVWWRSIVRKQSAHAESRAAGMRTMRRKIQPWVR